MKNGSHFNFPKIMKLAAFSPVQTITMMALASQCAVRLRSQWWRKKLRTGFCCRLSIIPYRACYCYFFFFEKLLLLLCELAIISCKALGLGPAASWPPGL